MHLYLTVLSNNLQQIANRTDVNARVIVGLKDPLGVGARGTPPTKQRQCKGAEWNASSQFAPRSSITYPHQPQLQINRIPSEHSCISLSQPSQQEEDEKVPVHVVANDADCLIELLQLAIRDCNAAGFGFEKGVIQLQTQNGILCDKRLGTVRVFC
ncbi:MAG TPA: hypothetical protein V6C81_31175 [Planktothrix sp.]